MFEQMESEGFYPPRFDNVGGLYFQVTLRNEPVYDRATIAWLRGFDAFGLTGDQKRLLAYARVHSMRFTSRAYQGLVGLDLYGASNSIKDLIHKGAVRSTGKGSRVYELVPEPQDTAMAWPDELSTLIGLLQTRGAVRNADVQSLLGLERKAAARLLERLELRGWAERVGRGRGTRYVPGPFLTGIRKGQPQNGP